MTLNVLGDVALSHGDVAPASARYDASMAAARSIGDERALAAG
jgi:hypothetical protein